MVVHKKVQHLIEKFVPELESYKKRLIFTGKEIENIINKRKAYELKLLRNKKNPSDFILYIRHEKILRKKRNKRILQAFVEAAETDKILENNILSIYKKALEKFEDPVLIKSFADFCIKSENHELLKDTLRQKCAKMAQNIDLWIFSANKLYQINDIIGAREFFLKGILLCARGNNRIYIEFFRLEIMHMKKILKFNRDNEIHDEDQSEENLSKVPCAVFEEFRNDATVLDIKECIMISKGHKYIVAFLEEELNKRINN